MIYYEDINNIHIHIFNIYKTTSLARQLFWVNKLTFGSKSVKMLGEANWPPKSFTYLIHKLIHLLALTIHVLVSLYIYIQILIRNIIYIYI